MSEAPDVPSTLDAAELVLCPVLKQVFIYRTVLQASQQIRGSDRGLQISLLYDQLSFQYRNWGGGGGWKRERSKPKGEQNANESIYIASHLMLIQLLESIFWLFPTQLTPGAYNPCNVNSVTNTIDLPK